MFFPRIMPVLLYKDGALVNSIGFKKYSYIGDAMNAVRIFNECDADEIILLDIDASKKDRVISLDFVKNVAEEANMPFSVGGGINSLNDIELLLKSGADKVVLNSSVIENSLFLAEAAKQFGSSTIVVCVDVKKNILGNYKVFSHKYKKFANLALLDYLLLLENSGAGELIIQSVDNDGKMEGYDLKLFSEIVDKISVPIVALGGGGGIEDIITLWKESNVNGFAGGSMFVHYNKMRGVLINYPKISMDEFIGKFAK